MKIYASSGDEGGGGIDVPDPQSGGGGGGAPDMSGYYAALQQQQDATRNAIAQAVMAQQAQQPQQGNPWGQTFSPRGQPSGSITDVGWMNALQPGQGGVSVGGQPGNPDLSQAAFTGGGSMRMPNANYWLAGAGRGLTPKVAGYDDSWLYGGGGPGNSGAFGGAAPGSNGISQGEMQQAIADVNSNRGAPYGNPNAPRGDPNSPQGLTGFEAYSRAQQDYNPISDPYNTPFTSFNQNEMNNIFGQFTDNFANNTSPDFGQYGPATEAGINAQQAASQSAASDNPMGDYGGYGGYGPY